MSNLIFPPDFVFGVATAAYQVEGAVAEDGRGPSIWDEFTHRAGKIHQNQNGDVACDHYHRYPEDIALMQEMGLDAYRLSLSWSRIIPEGAGAVNQKGLDYYRRLLDALLEAGITPYVTLFHWDMPLELHRRYGGFQGRQAAYDFADYAGIVARELGDRIGHFITLNEPWEHCMMGHFLGEHAPGVRKPWNYWKIMHHQLLGHALGMERIREVRPDAVVGITTSQLPVHPLTDREKDHRAAAVANEFMNFITLDPLLKGHYPEDLSRRLRWFAPDFGGDDLERISAPLDFVGINNSQREFARHSALMPFLKAWVVGSGKVSDRDYVKDGVQYTSMGWEVYPESIYEALKWLQDDYGNPTVMITENGAAFEDEVVDGVVDDHRRVAYLDAYLAQVKRAMDEGANVTGYFAWSLMDNFEWATGYSKRFGLVHVDYETQKRTIKNSGRWYGDLVRRSRSGGT